jgi:hypothetical protein
MLERGKILNGSAVRVRLCDGKRLTPKSLPDLIYGGWPEDFSSMRRIVLGTLATLVMLMPVGCDKRSESSTTPDQADQTPAPVQQPVSPARQNFSLLIMPLTLSIPAGWKLDPPDKPSFLEGPAPGGDVEISLTIMDAMDDNHHHLFVNGELDQSRLHPSRIRVRQLTSKTGLPLLERITYVTAPVQSLNSPPTTLPSQLLSWNVIVFVPYRTKIIPCSFDLIGLTQQQYDQDQPLIRALIDTATPAKTPAFP